MKTADLLPPELDYWVARADKTWEYAHKMFPTWTLDPTFKGVELRNAEVEGKICLLIPTNPMRQDPQQWEPSIDWSQAGPLIVKFGVDLEFWIEVDTNKKMCNASIYSTCRKLAIDEWNEEPLIAAMRAIVASVYGSSVDD